MTTLQRPKDFTAHLAIENAVARLDELEEVAGKIADAGIGFHQNLDHAAIFTDPPLLVTGPIKKLGYAAGWDSRSYPSPVDGHDYINVTSGLEEGAAARSQGWPEYIAVTHPVDEGAREHMLSQGYGNPFIHHLTLGIVPPDRASADDTAYAEQLVRFMIRARTSIRAALGQAPGALVVALPEQVTSRNGFRETSDRWLDELGTDEHQVESMEGGGFLLQFFVLVGGRIEVALRVGTSQSFNPKSVVKISRDEISAVQR